MEERERLYEKTIRIATMGNQKLMEFCTYELIAYGAFELNPEELVAGLAETSVEYALRCKNCMETAAFFENLFGGIAKINREPLLEDLSHMAADDTFCVIANRIRAVSSCAEQISLSASSAVSEDAEDICKAVLDCCMHIKKRIAS